MIRTPVTARMVVLSRDYEVEVEVRGMYVPGTPDRGPCYGDGGVQGDPPDVEDIEAEVLEDGRPSGVLIDLSSTEADEAYELLIEKGAQS